MSLTEQGLAKQLDQLKPGESAVFGPELGQLFGDAKSDSAAVRLAKMFAQKHNCLFFESMAREPHRFEKLDDEGKPVD